MIDRTWSFRDYLVDDEDMYAPADSQAGLDGLPELEEFLSTIPATQEHNDISLSNAETDELQLPTWERSLLTSEADQFIVSTSCDAIASPDRQIDIVHDTLGIIRTTSSVLFSLADFNPTDDRCRSPLPEIPVLADQAGLEDEDAPYSPLTTHNDPTPLSTPAAHTSQLLSASLSATRLRSRNSHIEKDLDSSDDHDSESDSDSGSEYNPDETSPSCSRIRPQRKRRVSAAVKQRRARTPSSASSDTPSLVSSSPLSSTSSVPDSPASSSSLLRRSRPRSRQVSTTSAPFSRKCSVCNYQPPRNCKAEMARHMNTHTYEERTRLYGPDWFCCGVPLEKAGKFGITDTSEARTWEHMGNQFMVGGCGQSFARKDVYKRHLRGAKCQCKGDSAAPWVPGNARRARAAK